MDEAEAASRAFPSIQLEAGAGLHVCLLGGGWEVWLNTEDADFTGLCLSVQPTREEAVAEAVTVLKQAIAALKGIV